MNHYPFEEWLFEEHLTQEEEKQLRAHLSECSECRELRTSISATDQLFGSIPLAEPTSGFTGRWVDYAHHKEQSIQKGWVWRLLITFALCAGVSILILQLPVLLSGVSITQMFTGMVLRIMDNAENIYSFVQSYRFILDVIPFRVPTIVWAAIGLNVVFWITIWSFSFWKVVGPKRSLK